MEPNFLSWDCGMKYCTTFTEEILNGNFICCAVKIFKRVVPKKQKANKQLLSGPLN